MRSPAIRSLVFLTGSLTLLACSGSYQVSTNLDPQQFGQYFTPSQVELLDTDTDLNQAKYLGTVTGDSCQAHLNDIPANDADARTSLRIQAAKLGANAVRIQSCQQIEPKPDCIQSRICIGQAVILDNN